MPTRESGCGITHRWQPTATAGNTGSSSYQHSFHGLVAFWLLLAPALFKVRSPHLVSFCCAAEARVAVNR
jgi:hypothetical protein